MAKKSPLATAKDIIGRVFSETRDFNSSALSNGGKYKSGSKQKLRGLVSRSKRQIKREADAAEVKPTEYEPWQEAVDVAHNYCTEIVATIRRHQSIVRQSVEGARDKPKKAEDFVKAAKDDLSAIGNLFDAIDSEIIDALNVGWKQGNLNRIRNGGKVRRRNAEDEAAKKIVDEEIRKENESKAALKKTEQENKTKEDNEKNAKDERNNAAKTAEANDWKEFERLLEKNKINLARNDEGLLGIPTASMRVLKFLLENKEFPREQNLPDLGKFEATEEGFARMMGVMREKGLIVIRKTLRAETMIDALEHGGFEIWFDEVLSAYCIRNRFLPADAERGRLAVIGKSDGTAIASAIEECLKYSVHITKQKVDGGSVLVFEPLKNTAWGGTSSGNFEVLIRNHGNRIPIINPIADFVAPLIERIDRMSSDERKHYEGMLETLFFFHGLIPDPEKGEGNKLLMQHAGRNFGAMRGMRLLQHLAKRDPRFAEFREDPRPQRETPILTSVKPNVGKTTVMRTMMMHPIIGDDDLRALTNNYHIKLRADQTTYEEAQRRIDGKLSVLLDEFEKVRNNEAAIKDLLTSTDNTYRPLYDNNPRTAAQSALFAGTANKYVLPDDPALLDRLTFIFVDRDPQFEGQGDLILPTAIKETKEKAPDRLVGMLSLAMRSGNVSFETPDHLKSIRSGAALSADQDIAFERSIAEELKAMAMDNSNPRMKTTQGKPMVTDVAFFLRAGWLVYPYRPTILADKDNNEWLTRHNGTVINRGEPISWGDVGVDAVFATGSYGGGIGIDILEQAMRDVRSTTIGRANLHRANRAMMPWQRETSSREIRARVPYGKAGVDYTGWRP